MADTQVGGAHVSRPISERTGVTLGLVVTFAICFAGSVLWITREVNAIHLLVLPTLSEIRANTGAMREDISEIRAQMQVFDQRLREIEQKQQ